MNLKALALITGFTNFIYAMGAILILPNFEELFAGFGAELPTLTKWVLLSYQYWSVLLVIPIFIFVFYLTKKNLSEKIEKKIQNIFVVLLVFFGLLLPVVIVSLYLPIFLMGTVIES